MTTKVQRSAATVWHDVALPMDDSDDTDAESLTPGFEQLQRAALEAVHAARAVLDVAESMIREPAAVEAMINTVSAMARTATESFSGFASGMAANRPDRPDRPAPHDPDKAHDPDDEPDDGTYQRIDLD